MHDSNTADWLARQTIETARELILSSHRSYIHPYGFEVHRVQVDEIRPWEVRVHVWPDSTTIFRRMSRAATESQLVHSHGWTLLSRVLSGRLEERTFRMNLNSSGAYGVYDVAGAKPLATSELLFTGRADLNQLNVSVRKASDVVYRIPQGTLHCTLPQAPSVSLVATDQRVGQVSRVLAHGDFRERIGNTTYHFRSTGSEMPVASESEWTSAFIFFALDSEVLLCRTAARPNSWQPIGGRREQGDASSMATAVREAREETGLDLLPSSLRWLGTQPSETDSGTAHFWTAPLPSPPNIHRDIEEILEVRWWDHSEAVQLPMYPGSRQALEHLIDQTRGS